MKFQFPFPHAAGETRQKEGALVFQLVVKPRLGLKVTVAQGVPAEIQHLAPEQQLFNMTVPGTFCYPNPAWKNTPGSTDFRKEILEVVKLADFIR